MKKLFIIFSLIFVVATIQAQSVTTNIFSYKNNASNFLSYDGLSVDTAAATASIKYKVFDLRQANTPVNWVMSSTITRISGNVADHKITVDKSYDGVNWIALNGFILTDVASTVTNWASGDTVSKIYVPYLRFGLDSDGTGVTKIEKISVKFYPKN